MGLGNSKNSKFSEWSGLVSQLESLVTSGDHDACRKKLSAINPKKVPRKHAVEIADIAFRINESLYSLKVLQGIIFVKNKFNKLPASDLEKTVYSKALSSLGVIGGALDILESVNVDTLPEALFCKASAHIYEWNYKEASICLTRFVKSAQISDYRRLVGKVNLVAALINLDRLREAASLLKEVEEECVAGAYRLLLGNCYQLQAQIDIFDQNYESAADALGKARDLLKQQGGTYYLLVDKWDIIRKGLTGSSGDLISKFDELRLKAAELRSWNTLRDCDLFQAILLKEPELFRKVIMGTPSEYFRTRARKLYGANLKPVGKFNLVLGPKAGDGIEVLHFDPYKRNGRKSALYEHPLLLSLFDALTQDFYQPSTLGILFQRIYKDERFNPFTSPARVLQLLRRLNDWFEENDYPMRAEFRKSEFALVSNEPYFIEIKRGAKLTPIDGKYSDLKKQVRQDSFSLEKVTEILQISKSSAERLISGAKAKGHLVAEKRRIGTSYRFLSKRQKRRAA